MNVAFEALGIMPIEYNPYIKTGINRLTGESLLNPDGSVNHEKHEEAVKMVRAALPEFARPYGELIERSLTLNDSKRFRSIEELVLSYIIVEGQITKATNLENRTNPWGWNWKSLTAAAILGVALVGTTELNHYRKSRNQNHSAAQRSQIGSVSDKNDAYKVVSAVNGEGLEVGNNLFDLNLSAFIPPKGQGPAPVYPDAINHILAEPGDGVYVMAEIVNKPLPTDKHGIGPSVPSFTSRVYFEGSEGKLIRLISNSYNRAISGEAAGYQETPTIPIPKNIKPGNYRLVVEVYPPAEHENYFAQEKLQFMTPTKVLARKAIPVRIGKDTVPVTLKALNLDIPNEVSMKGYGGRFDWGPDQITTQVKIEDQTFVKEKDRYLNFNIPRGPIGQPLVVNIAALDNQGRTIYQTAGLIERITDSSNYAMHTVPGKEFYKTLRQIMPFPEQLLEK
jgi:hypothetical protein